MKIRAKMQCSEIAKNLHAGEQVTLNAVMGGSEENKSFSRWTPSATVSMQISNPDALGAFEVGKEYFVDFSPAASPVKVEPEAEAVKPETVPPAAPAAGERDGDAKFGRVTAT